MHVNCKKSLLRGFKHKTLPWFCKCLLASIWSLGGHARVSAGLCLYLPLQPSSGVCYCLWWDSLLGFMLFLSLFTKHLSSLVCSGVPQFLTVLSVYPLEFRSLAP